MESSRKTHGREVRELTVRAILTGFVIGALLVPCNIYSGLKIGWSFNMSVAAALIGYAFWNGLAKLGVGRPIGLLENNINQTSASSAASIISAGLVAPIPALTLLTGEQLAYPVLCIWVFVVSFTGIVVAIGIRNQMLVRENLPFPSGVATAETIREIYSHGREAAYRLRLLATGAVVSGVLKLYSSFIKAIPPLPLPIQIGLPGSSALASKGYGALSAANVGFVIDPSLLMIGFGAIVGMRVGASLLVGAVIGWGVFPGFLLDAGWVDPGPPDPGVFWYSEFLEWLLWPGVSLMVSASLTSFALSLVRLLRRRITAQDAGSASASNDLQRIPPGWFRAGLVLALTGTVAAQMVIFGISWWLATLAFFLTFLLAVVAARISGETGIPPIGALGKVTQVTFGLLSPANPTVNLMAANVTGGAAGQCSDLLHDLKTGLLVGATLRYQTVAQVFGVMAGSLAGTAAYLILIPNPQEMLLTPEWPAPAVATWKAVAEALTGGFGSLPPGCIPSAIGAGILGICLAGAEHWSPVRLKHFVPSAASLGFALIIPASISISLFLGALLSEGVKRVAPTWQARYMVVVAAGLVAGESLAGVMHALAQLVGGAH